MGNLYSISSGRNPCPEFVNLRNLGRNIVTTLRRVGYSHWDTSFDFSVEEDEGIFTINYRERPVAEIVAHRGSANISLNELWLIGWDKREIQSWIKSDEPVFRRVNNAQKEDFRRAYNFIEHCLSSSLNPVEKPYAGTTIYERPNQSQEATHS